jgi:hypothetical protein
MSSTVSADGEHEQNTQETVGHAKGRERSSILADFLRTWAIDGRIHTARSSRCHRARRDEDIVTLRLGGIGDDAPDDAVCILYK